jgi:hypothetical protein
MKRFLLLLTQTSVQSNLLGDFILVLLLLGVSGSLCAQDGPASTNPSFTEAQIKEDVALLGQIIQHIHPAPYKYTDTTAFQAALASLEQEMLRQPDLISAYTAISAFVAKIKCSHTFTNPWNQGQTVQSALFNQSDKLPFTFSRIGKRLFIDKNASDNTQLKKGLEILSINGVETAALLAQLAPYVTADGNNFEKKLERLSLNGTEKYSLFDIFYTAKFGSSDQFRLELKDFYTREVFTTTVASISKKQRGRRLKERYPDMMASARDGWKFRLLNDSAGILQIQSFSVYRNEFDWKGIIDEAIDTLNAQIIPNLIIDIRGNEGGQGEVGEYLLRKVITRPFKAPAVQASVRYLTIPEAYQKHIGTWDKFPYDFTKKVSREEEGRFFLKSQYSAAGKTYKPSKDGYRRKVYLIIDASNSSATHLMAAYAKQTGEITLVGQETGGNQLGTNGNYIFFLNLPNTGIEVDIPVVNMFVPPASGSARDGGIVPDVKVERSWESLVLGKDDELEKIRSLIRQP